MKLELTIKVTYLPEWGTWEGVRELVQNARDEEVRTGYPLVVRHTGKVLRLFNEEARLHHKDLLFGQTDKVDRSDLAGKFGEGLKLGTLALIRAGHDVKIRTGTEIWTPSIEYSKQFDEKVLVFAIRQTSKDAGGTSVEISGIEPLQWAKMREKFLFLASLGSDEFLDVPGRGKIITSERFKSKMFVKGIFVQDNEEYLYGYDFDDLETDRDRKLIDPFNLKWTTSIMWRQAVAGSGGRQFVGDFYNALVENSPDVSSLSEHYAQNLPDEIVDDMKDMFAETHGELAVPVTNLEESRELAYLGFTGVIVGKALMHALLSKSGGIDGIKRRGANRVAKRYSWHDLSDRERSAFDGALDAFALSGDELDRTRVEVVGFRDERQMGMYDNGRILLSRGQLEDPSRALCTLIHEVAHAHGPDGNQKHVAAIEKTWTAIHAAMLKEGGE